MKFTIDDIHRLDLQPWHLDEKPEHPWQQQFMVEAIRAGKLSRLTALIRAAHAQQCEWSKELAKRFKGRGIDVEHVDITDKQMEGLETLNPMQVRYLRSRGLPLKATPGGLLIEQAPDCDMRDAAALRARAAWLYLENSWQRRTEARKSLAGGAA